MNDQLQALKTKIGEANSTLLVIPENPSQDVVAASLAFYLSLSQSGKTSTIVSSSSPVVRDSHLVGLDKITTDVGGENLVITLNVPENVIDKVTSNTEGGHLNLIINPAKGTPAITDKDIKFSYSGATADLVIVIGAADLKDIGVLADKEQSLFDVAKLVNISNQVGTFGSVNITDPSSSNSELITALLKELALPLDVDIANNLMRGIEEATGGLSSPNMTADTFEALAVLYRTGARRTAPTKSSPTAKIINDMPIVDNQPVEDSTREADTPSPDWLQPKIFKGTSTK